MENIECIIPNIQDLALACLPFIKNGGLFIKMSTPLPLDTQVKVSLKLMKEATALEFLGKIVLIIPKCEYPQFPEGIGIQFSKEDATRVSNKIEAILPNAFAIDRKEAGLFV